MRVHFLGFASIVGVLVTLSAPVHATPASCTNDVDCPESACGGQVCSWTASSTGHVCVAANTDDQGWCTTDSDCKCNAYGATCDGVHCTFTALVGDAGVVSEAGPLACTNDVDCPVAACGGEVCSWSNPAGHFCIKASSGDPGWCTTDADCKCMGAGATCTGSSTCSFTTPPADAGPIDAGAIDAGPADGGATDATTPHDAGSATDAGSTVDATTPHDSGSATDATTGQDASTASGSSGGGGCSTSAGGSRSGLGGLAWLAAIAAWRRRRSV